MKYDIPESVVCPVCNGEKKVFEDAWSFATGSHTTIDYECPVCLGEGDLEFTYIPRRFIQEVAERYPAEIGEAIKEQWYHNVEAL